VAAIAAGDVHSCALLTTGAVKCWGRNNKGQLGDNTTTNSNAPVSVSGLTGGISITAGAQHTCALTTGGAGKCWGYNTDGEVGDNTTT
jgi:alpha-tubulin suppressor-like RCC1 family protein